MASPIETQVDQLVTEAEKDAITDVAANLPSAQDQLDFLIKHAEWTAGALTHLVQTFDGIVGALMQSPMGGLIAKEMGNRG